MGFNIKKIAIDIAICKASIWHVVFDERSSLCPGFVTGDSEKSRNQLQLATTNHVQTS